MNQVREYATQSVFAVLQSALIIGGSMATAALMKARGFPDPTQFWHPLALFVRNWGFLLISFPGIWVVTTIWLERNRCAYFSTRGTFVSGLIVLAAFGLLMLFSIMLGGGTGTIIQSIE